MGIEMERRVEIDDYYDNILLVKYFLFVLNKYKLLSNYTLILT